MFPIVINSQYLTLGPVVSNQKGYSAGHAGSGSVTGVDDVYKVVFGPGNTWGKGLPLGKAASRFGGKDKDWSVITANALEKLGPIVKEYSPVMNETVYMWGAVSTITSGKVTGTNMLVTVNGVTLEGMCSGSYSCKKGDSGAGIFNNDSLSGNNTQACGIQSSALFKSDDTWAGTSYFTPFPLA